VLGPDVRLLPLFAAGNLKFKFQKAVLYMFTIEGNISNIKCALHVNRAIFFK
jgi:hypothetical protein